MDKKANKDLVGNSTIVLIGIVAAFLIFNQTLISGIEFRSSGSMSLDGADIYSIKNTAQAINLLFPINEIQSEEDAITMMITQGTPDYGASMGITFNDPVGALSLLANNYNTIKEDIKQSSPEVWDRYLSLATKPVGISCEFCCGVGPIGITKSGDLKCGCKHNPAIQSLTMLLMKDTNMNDAEILKEAIKWKSVWFPRDMVGLSLKAAGGDVETALPGMVGGC